MEYGLVDYDVKDIRRNHCVYGIIYKHLRKVSLRYTDSVYLVNLAHAAEVQQAMQDINGDLAKAGKAVVEFHTTRIHPDSAEEVRGRSVMALTEMVQGIAGKLNNAIDKMEQELRDHASSINMHDWSLKRKNRVRDARKELALARGLALIFMLEADVVDAVEASEKIVKARALAAGILK